MSTAGNSTLPFPYTIDGNAEDWPIPDFTTPAILSANGTLTTGDHFVLDTDTTYWNGENSWDGGPEDLSATTYIAWDDDAFYVLNIARDSEIGFEHASANTVDADGFFTGNSTGWTSDGIEFWLDNDNDRLPDVLGDTPNDLQFDVLIDDALQRRDFPDLPEEDYGLTMNTFSYQYKEIFGTSAEYNDGGDLEYELLSTVETATQLDSDNMGYTMEIRIPFGTFNEFVSTHPIGINISWADWDKGVFSNHSWNGVLANQPPFFEELRFTDDLPLGGEISPVKCWDLF